MDFTTYLTQSGIIIAAGLYALGVLLKKAPFFPDWCITLALTALGILAAGFSMDGGFTVPNIIQGIFATGVAVLVNQTGKQVATKDVGAKFDAAHPADDVQPAEDLGEVETPADITAKGADQQ